MFIASWVKGEKRKFASGSFHCSLNTSSPACSLSEAELSLTEI